MKFFIEIFSLQFTLASISPNNTQSKGSIELQTYLEPRKTQKNYSRLSFTKLRKFTYKFDHTHKIYSTFLTFTRNQVPGSCVLWSPAVHQTRFSESSSLDAHPPLYIFLLKKASRSS